jgi:hypothetical protein
VKKEITVNDCRKILKNLKRGIKKDPVLGNYIDAINNLSYKKRFVLAKELLPELESSGILAGTGFGSSRTKEAEVYTALLSSLEMYAGIPREEFIELITNPNSYVVVTYLVKNKALPIDLLLSELLLHGHKNKFFYWIMKKQLEDVKLLRYPEIISHFRSIVPDSKHMSDDMVLKIANFTF